MLSLVVFWARPRITPGYLTEMFRLQAALPEHLKQLKAWRNMRNHILLIWTFPWTFSLRRVFHLPGLLRFYSNLISGERGTSGYSEQSCFMARSKGALVTIRTKQDSIDCRKRTLSKCPIWESLKLALNHWTFRSNPTHNWTTYIKIQYSCYHPQPQTTSIPKASNTPRFCVDSRCQPLVRCKFLGDVYVEIVCYHILYMHYGHFNW